MNIFKRLMNVVFILWLLWVLWVLFMVVVILISGLELSEIGRRLGRSPNLTFSIFLGWLPILAVNYILNNKATVWNKHGDKL